MSTVITYQSKVRLSFNKIIIKFLNYVTCFIFQRSTSNKGND